MKICKKNSDHVNNICNKIGTHDLLKNYYYHVITVTRNIKNVGFVTENFSIEFNESKLKMNIDVDPSKELNDEVPNDSLTLGQLRKIVKQFPNKQKVKKTSFCYLIYTVITKLKFVFTSTNRLKKSPLSMPIMIIFPVK